MPQLRRSNLQVYGFVSTVLFLSTIVNAFRLRSNFFSAAVYLSESNACMMILWNQGIFQTVLVGKLLQSAFFGSLRDIEVERLQERGWFAVTETLLALTIFRDEFDSAFILLFVSLLFLKVFHWLASDRIELMEHSTNLSTRFHIRMTSLLASLWIADTLFLIFAINTILIDGPTVMIMFASEYMILVATIGSLTMKYILNLIDLRSEVEWEQKSMLVFYVDLVTDFLKLVTYLTFFCVILTFYGLPLNILRDVYITFRSFVIKCRDLMRFRKATQNMETLYPNVTEQEMLEMNDKTCIICREDMEFRGISTIPIEPVDGEAVPPPAPAPIPTPPRTGPNDTPKKLPCGHVFHYHCLRSWLERQQSCPTCRRSVLLGAPTPTPPPTPPQVPGDGQDPAGIDPLRQAQINLARNLGREAYGVIFPGLPYPEEALLPAPVPIPAAAAIPEPTPTPTPATADSLPAPTHDGPGPEGDRTAIPRPTPALLRPTMPTPRTSSATTPTISSINPLATFSLPSLPLPPAGEAGLYSPPPVLAPEGYAGLAFGGSLSVGRGGYSMSSMGNPRAGGTFSREMGRSQSGGGGGGGNVPKSLAELASITATTSAVSPSHLDDYLLPTTSTSMATAGGYPRLIPLSSFLANSNQSSASTSAIPIPIPISAPPTSRTLKTQRQKDIVEVMREFQSKLDDLNNDFKRVMNSLTTLEEDDSQPISEMVKDFEEIGDRVDKGKRPTEGIHAAL